MPHPSPAHSSAHSVIHLGEVDHATFSERQASANEARMIGQALGLEQLGMVDLRVPAREESPFAHQKHEHEELYIVVEGDGTIHLDGITTHITRGDAVRIAPHVRRTLTAGEHGMHLYCIGASPLTITGDNDPED